MWSLKIKKRAKKKGTEWTRRTKKMLTYLGKEMTNKPSIKFSKVVQGKTRQTAAAVFYQLLVLKTHTYVNLQQEQPYGDITITKDDNFSKRTQPA